MILSGLTLVIEVILCIYIYSGKQTIIHNLGSEEVYNSVCGYDKLTTHMYMRVI